MDLIALLRIIIINISATQTTGLIRVLICRQYLARLSHLTIVLRADVIVIKARFLGWVVITTWEWVRITPKQQVLLLVRNIKLMSNLSNRVQHRRVIKILSVISRISSWSRRRSRRSSYWMMMNKFLIRELRFSNECRCKWCDWRGKCNEIIIKHKRQIFRQCNIRIWVVAGIKRVMNFSISQIEGNKSFSQVKRKNKTSNLI